MKDEYRLAGCFGKESFDTYSAAERIVMNKKRGHKARMFVYKCKNCGKFHLTGNKQSKGFKCR